MSESKNTAGSGVIARMKNFDQCCPDVHVESASVGAFITYSPSSVAGISAAYSHPGPTGVSVQRKA